MKKLLILMTLIFCITTCLEVMVITSLKVKINNMQKEFDNYKQVQKVQIQNYQSKVERQVDSCLRLLADGGWESLEE